MTEQDKKLQLLKEDILTFAKNNKLDPGKIGRSSRNGHQMIIIGYALYKGIEDSQILADTFSTYMSNKAIDTEFQSLFNYCKKRNYGDWWKVESNREEYNIA